MENVYPFAKEPREFSQLTDSAAYKLMERLNSGEKFSNNDELVPMVFEELWHPDAYRTGKYKLLGWVFNFNPFFKRFVVKYKHYGWQEQYAPNKTFIRKYSANPSWILEIAELPSQKGQ